MAKTLGTLSRSGKTATLAIIAVLLVMTGIGSALLSGAMQKVVPGGSPTASRRPAASSAALVPAGQVQSVVTASRASQGQLDILQAKINDAWSRNDWPQAIESISALLLIQPDNAAMRERLYQARLNYAWFLMANQKLVECAAQFAQAAEVKPGGWEAQEGQKLVQQLLQTVSPAGAATAAPATATPLSAITATPVPPTATPHPTQAATAAPVVQPTQAANTICYVVQPGDNLFRLARRFNTTIETIVAVNRLPGLEIKAFQTLLIPAGPCPQQVDCHTPTPPPAPTCAPCASAPVPVNCGAADVRCYIVRRGDNLFRLALHFNVSVGLLMQVNHLQTTKITVGQVLIIP